MKITILGAGKQGVSIAQALNSADYEITMIDRDSDVIEKLQSRMDIKCINADAEDIDSLRSAMVQTNDVLIACTHSDDKNIVLCSIAKELGVKKCFARVRSLEKIDQIDLIKRAMKIDRILNPDLECAKEIYKSLTNHLGYSEGYKMVNGLAYLELSVDKLPNLQNKALKESTPYLKGLLVGAISRNGKIIIPNGDTVFQENDIIYALGTRSEVAGLRDLLNNKGKSNRVNRVMIAGGGKTSRFLSKQLLDDGIEVKIIEADRSRAEYIADILDKAMVVYGDATDSDLLFEEELDGMDAFVACTGLDEENYMLAMYAKQHGVSDSIAKITRTNYGTMFEKLGDVMMINSTELCTAYVLRNIADDSNVVFSKLIQGQAEFLEIAVNDSMPIIGKSLKDLHIPEGIIIAAIFRGGDMITPRGSTIIEKNDKIIVLSMLSQIPALNKLLNANYSEEF